MKGLFKMEKDYNNSRYPSEKGQSPSGSSWRGPFTLPDKLSAFYQYFGPMDLALSNRRSFQDNSSPFYLPRLADLWQYQAGYGYDPRSGWLREGWQEDWLAIGDDGSRPFIFAISNSRVLFDPYSDGLWNPVELFSSLEEMIQVLCILSSITVSAGSDLRNASLEINPQYKEDVFIRVVEITKCLDRAKTILTLLSWY